MSASDERWEYHLTPGGWQQGSKKLDFSGWTHVDPPTDRLLTVTFSEHLSSSFSRMDVSADIEKHAEDTAIISALQTHGVAPKPGADRYRGWPEFLKTLGL